jgi:uncharacterized protein YjbI with pentapeptide repeats
VSRLRPGGDHEGETFDGLVEAGVDAEGARFLDCTWTSSVVSQSAFERTTWRGCRLRGVRFVGVGLARSNWQDVVLTGCALSGCELLGSRWRGVRVEGGRLDTVNLRSSELREVIFEDCVLGDVDLAGARLTDVTFPGCRIERLELTKATLARVDLRGASVGIARGVDRLAGAVVDAAQLLELAPLLAAHVGLEVRAVGAP